MARHDIRFDFPGIAFEQPIQIFPAPKVPAQDHTKRMLALIDQPFGWNFNSLLEHYLLQGANPNATRADGKLFLHAMIEKLSYNQDPTPIKYLHQYGANIFAKDANGHSTTSLALENNQHLAALFLFNKGVSIPANKLNNPYLQAVDKLLHSKQYAVADFIDVNATNKCGANLLHFAVALNDSAAIKKLIGFGVNPLLQDNAGQSPLKLACGLKHEDSVKTIIDHHLTQHDTIQKYTDFTLFKAKNDGITIGGFYKDSQGEKWLLKEGHHDCAEAVVKEYIAGGLYQEFLGSNAPQTEMVIDNLHGKLLTASKLLSNFKTLSDMTHDNGFGYNPYNWSPYGSDFPATFNGKPVKEFMDGVSAIVFMRDTDAHSGNTGLTDHGDHYSFAKIDHGFSFNFSYFNDFSLDDFRVHLKQFYNIDNLEHIGFNDVYQSVSKIANLSFSVIEDIVADKISQVKTHMEALELKDLHEGYHKNHHGKLETHLLDYETKLIDNLKDQHQNYQKVANFMSLEKAIIDHDTTKLDEMIEKGVKLNEPFKPFFNAKSDLWGHGTQSVTGLDLGKKHWPELFDSKPLHNDTDTTSPLTIQDIFGGNDNVVGLNTPVLNIPVINQMMDLFVAPVHVEVL